MIKKSLFSFLLILTGELAYSQHTFMAVVKDKATDEALAGVSALAEGTGKGAVSDAEGNLNIPGIPAGRQAIIFRLTGYETLADTFEIPLPDEKPVLIFLVHTAEELDEIIVEATRSNRSIENIPTRVEVLTEEIDEAATMDPSKIAHLLTHSTGIQVQQTSATSNTANVRIQGLDGRYTQILKDGFPLYGGFSGSLSIMQIPPLDLRQIEYIKGSASTLYGGGAISGIINLLSKEPGKDETLLHLNASQVGALDANTFFSRREGKTGITVLAQRNEHFYYDADKDGFSDLPQLLKYNLNPKLFFYFSEKTKMSAGATLTDETREGGDVYILQGKQADSARFYHEKNDTRRITSQFKLEHKLRGNQTLSARNSFSLFNRKLSINPSFASGEYRFAGEQVSSFSEAAYTIKKKQNVFIAGVNFYSDDFREEKLDSPVLRDEVRQTFGIFSNYTFDLGKKTSFETGMRADYEDYENIYLLPRAFALFKWTQKLTTRVGGGMGYRHATVFNQEAELLGYKNVLPVDKSSVKAEQSYGGNIDISYKTPLGENLFIHINQLFFYTRLDNPLVLADIGFPSGIYSFRNANGYTQSAGAETFFKFGFYDFVFFAGYTYTQAQNYFSANQTELTLTPRHSLKGDLLYSLPGKWRIGADYEFKGTQKLSDGRTTKPYWTFGAVVERTLGKFTLLVNVENFADVRQTRYESLLSAAYQTPQFTEVWAPLDGFVINGGVKVRW